MNVTIFWDIEQYVISLSRILPSYLLSASILLGLFLTPKMEVIRFSETSVHILTTRCYIPDNGNVHNYCCEYLKNYEIFHNFFKLHVNLFAESEACFA
jgi:hypothetical protein